MLRNVSTATATRNVTHHGTFQPYCASSVSWSVPQNHIVITTPYTSGS